MEVYGPEFTKETKSEATVVFTSGLIYKYTKVESEYTGRTLLLETIQLAAAALSRKLQAASVGLATPASSHV
ncbi:hypothetical protein BGY98DRAFT_1192874 [Russula aff. rugulosa BPL654]|nr:hypothetical protein BGY98DRAFT_1192874 [Russula aff. rugulosa BPL654]